MDIHDVLKNLLVIPVPPCFDHEFRAVGCPGVASPFWLWVKAFPKEDAPQQFVDHFLAFRFSAALSSPFDLFRKFTLAAAPQRTRNNSAFTITKMASAVAII